MKVFISFLLICLSFFFGMFFQTYRDLEKIKQLKENPPAIQLKNLNDQILWSLVQNWRLENNLKPYTKDQNLCKHASNRAKEISTYFSHDAFEQNFKKYSSIVVENIASEENETHTFNAWLESKSHLETLKRDFKYSCVQTYNHFAVQIFSNCENGCP